MVGFVLMTETKNEKEENNEIQGWRQGKNQKTWEDDADRMPIAFDVEKVVREIRDLKLSYYMTIANTGDADKDYVYLNVANAIDTAIEIVKRGGRDD